MIGQARRILEFTRLNSPLNSGVKAKCPLVAFLSGKGGTGKSFTILNIALALAAAKKKVLLIDFDINMANLHIMLNLIPRQTIYQFFTLQNDINGIISRVNSNLDCIFGESGRDFHPEMNEKNISEFFKEIYNISGNYDYILIDNGFGISKNLDFIIKFMSDVLIVLNPEPTSVMDAYVVLKTIKAANFVGKKYVVVNKTFDVSSGEDNYFKLKQASSHFLKEDIEYLGAIGFDIEVPKSIQDQNPLWMAGQGKQIYNQIKTVSDSILKNIHMHNNSQK